MRRKLRKDTKVLGFGEPFWGKSEVACGLIFEINPCLVLIASARACLGLDPDAFIFSTLKILNYL